MIGLRLCEEVWLDIQWKIARTVEYFGDVNNRHSKSENLQNPNFLLSGIQMVDHSNTWHTVVWFMDYLCFLGPDFKQPFEDQTIVSSIPLENWLLLTIQNLYKSGIQIPIIFEFRKQDPGQNFP